MKKALHTESLYNKFNCVDYKFYLSTSSIKLSALSTIYWLMSVNMITNQK